LGWVLAVANLALASAMFVEPILFGRIVDTLANAQPRVSQIAWRDLMLLVGAWVSFGLFIIVCSTLVALHADLWRTASIRWCAQCSSNTCCSCR